ncbi:HAD hydrolase subfamily IA REG-2-like protein [Marasmius fiardii PR-910]|nr:HAD hydrolase subfamily IA REG-2-like protein [Marasmius fiardii PR-910]
MLVRPRLVIFDVLHTLITPRLPVHVQYAQVFQNFLGGPARNFTIDPLVVKSAFKLSLRQLQEERPAYIGEKGSEGWWQEVIRRTILGSCIEVDENQLASILPQISQDLIHRFSSKEGYRAFDDTFSTLNILRSKNMLTAAASNSDSRMRSVLKSLDFPNFLSPILLSEEEGIEKPNPEIFLRILTRVNGEQRTKYQPNGWVDITPQECLHIGDDLTADYHGARNAGLQALLLVREHDEGQTHSPEEKELVGVRKISRLEEALTAIGMGFPS